MSPLVGCRLAKDEDGNDVVEQAALGNLSQYKFINGLLYSRIKSGYLAPTRWVRDEFIENLFNCITIMKAMQPITIKTSHEDVGSGYDPNAVGHELQGRRTATEQMVKEILNPSEEEIKKIEAVKDAFRKLQGGNEHEVSEEEKKQLEALKDVMLNE